MSNFQIWMAGDFILLSNVFYDDGYWFYNVRPSGAEPISGECLSLSCQTVFCADNVL